ELERRAAASRTNAPPVREPVDHLRPSERSPIALRGPAAVEALAQDEPARSARVETDAVVAPASEGATRQDAPGDGRRVERSGTRRPRSQPDEVRAQQRARRNMDVLRARKQLEPAPALVDA